MFNIKSWLKSPQGRNLLIFLVCLVFSTILWVIFSMDGEIQQDLRCRVSINNVPDTVTRVSPMPEAINVSVRGRAIDLIKYSWMSSPAMSIDYRIYHTDNRIQFNESMLRAFFSKRIGSSSQVMSVSPDSLCVYFTSHPGVELPVKVDATVVPGPQYAIIGKVRADIDSVMVYGINGVPSRIRYIPTEPITLNDVSSSRTIRVPLMPPAGMRAIPDSVDIHIEVEPLVSKNRKVNVTPVGVPAGIRLIPVPTEVDVYYMVPMSVYKKHSSDPKFRVEVDYSSIHPGSNKAAVSLASAPKEFINVFLGADSVEYIIEHR